MLSGAGAADSRVRSNRDEHDVHDPVTPTNRLSAIPASRNLRGSPSVCRKSDGCGSGNRPAGLAS